MASIRESFSNHDKSQVLQVGSRLGRRDNMKLRTIDIEKTKQ